MTTKRELKNRTRWSARDDRVLKLCVFYKIDNLTFCKILGRSVAAIVERKKVLSLPIEPQGLKAPVLSREESTIERFVAREAKGLGYEVLKLRVQGQRGVPDRLFIHEKTDPFTVEFKATGAEPEKLQDLVHRRFRKRNMPVYVIDNTADGLDLIYRVLR